MYPIVVPSYLGHMRELEIFLESLAAKLVDPEKTEVHVTVSKKEQPLFERAFTNRFCPLQVRIRSLSEILQVVEKIEIDEDELLGRVGKFNFQSIKKLWTVKAIGAPLALVQDSEGQVIRPFSVESLFSWWTDQGKILYSSHYGAPLQTAVTRNCLKMLNQPFEDKWMFAYQYWFFEKETIDLLFEEVPRRTQASLFEHFTRSQPIFEFVLYAHLLREYFPERCVDSDREISHFLGETKASQFFQRYQALGASPMEYIAWGMRNDNLEEIRAFFESQELHFFKFDDRWKNAENRATQIKFIETFEDIWFLPCLVNTESFEVNGETIGANFSIDLENKLLSRSLPSVIAIFKNMAGAVQNPLKRMASLLLGELKISFRKLFAGPKVVGIPKLRISTLEKNCEQSQFDYLGEDSELALDIGAFVGNSVQRITQMGYRKIICVEPNPVTFRELRRNYTSSETSKLRYAVGSEPGIKVSFTVDKDHPWLTSSGQSWVRIHALRGLFKKIYRFKATTTTLDNIILAVGKIPGYVKLDVEGNEVDALKGLSTTPRLVSLEWVSETPEVSAKILGEMRTRGYSRFLPLAQEDVPQEGSNWIPLDRDRSLLEVQKILDPLGTWGNLWFLK